jgi:hypothetical protein
MIEDTDNRLQALRDHADKIGLREQLEREISFLDTYAEHGNRGATRCILYHDFAPFSLGFTMYRGQAPWFNGGLIFHGSHDGHGSGAFPSLSVCIDPTDGWQIHT